MRINRLHREIRNGLILSIPIWLLMLSTCLGATYYVDPIQSNMQTGTGTILDPYSSADQVVYAVGGTAARFRNGAIARSEVKPAKGTAGSHNVINGYRWDDVALVGTTVLTGVPEAHGLMAFSRGGHTYLYCGLTTSGIRIYNVDTPSAPVLKYSHDQAGANCHGAIYDAMNDCLYVAGREGGLLIYALDQGGHDLETGNLDASALVNVITTPVAEGKATGLAIDTAKDILYVANRTKGWYAIDISNADESTHAVIVGLGSSSNYEVHRAAVVKNPDGDGADYLYLPSYTGFSIEDITDTATPAPVRKSTLLGQTQYPWDVQARGNLAFVTAGRGYDLGENYPGLYVFDCTTKTSPHLIGKWVSDDVRDCDASCETPPQDFILAGNYALISMEWQGLVIVDVADPKNPSLYRTIPAISGGGHDANYGPVDVWALNDIIYVVSDSKTDDTDVMIQMYQVSVVDASWEISGTALQTGWAKDGTTKHLIDDYFQENGTNGFYSGSVYWDGALPDVGTFSVSTANVNSTDGHLRATIPNGITSARLQRTITPQTEYQVEWKVAWGASTYDPTKLSYFYPLKHVNPLDTSDVLTVAQITGDVQPGGTTIKYRLRYYYDDTHYADSAYSDALNMDGSFHTLKIIYKISTDAAGYEVELLVNGTAVAQVDVDTSALTKAPNLLEVGLYGRLLPTEDTADQILDVDEWHYHNTTMDTSVGTTNLWYSSSMGADNAINVLFHDKLFGSKKANKISCTANGDWYSDTSTSPDTIHYYSSTDPNISINAPGIEVGYLSNIITFGIGDEYIDLISASIYGARGTACLTTSTATSCTLQESIVRHNGLRGIYDDSSGSNLFLNITLAYNLSDGIEFSKSAGTATMKNCISYINTTYQAQAVLSGTGALTHDHNLFWDGNSTDVDGIVVGGDEIGADPLFTSPATGDFHLRPNSPARNAGADLGDDYDIDFDGNDQDRYGRGWEIGAHVFKECPVGIGW